MSANDFQHSKESMVQEVFQVEMNLFADKQNQNKLFGSNVIQFHQKYSLKKKKKEKKIIVIKKVIKKSWEFDYKNNNY